MRNEDELLLLPVLIGVESSFLKSVRNSENLSRALPWIGKVSVGNRYRPRNMFIEFSAYQRRLSTIPESAADFRTGLQDALTR